MDFLIVLGIFIPMILWLICAIICCRIAKSKYRSAVGWFFIGFSIGILGVIIISCLPPNECIDSQTYYKNYAGTNTYNQYNSSKKENKWTCPNCKTRNPMTNNRCYSCGQSRLGDDAE